MRKLEGIKYSDLKNNITITTNKIPKEIYKNIFLGAYNRDEIYVKKKGSRKRSFKQYKD